MHLFIHLYVYIYISIYLSLSLYIYIYIYLKKKYTRPTCVPRRNNRHDWRIELHSLCWSFGPFGPLALWALWVPWPVAQSTENTFLLVVQSTRKAPGATQPNPLFSQTLHSPSAPNPFHP